MIGSSSQRSVEPQRQQGYNPHRGQSLGEPHRRNRSDARADEGAHELAGRAAGENERQRQPDESAALAPLAVSTNGRNSRNPIRVALSRMPIASSTGKAKRMRSVARAVGRRVPRCMRRGHGAVPRGQHEDRSGGQEADTAEKRKRRPPRHDEQQQRGRGRHRHLAEIAGEVVSAERLHRASAGEGARHQRGGERMLDAGAEAADEQREHEQPEARAGAGKAIADAGERRAERQHRRARRDARRATRREFESRPWCRQTARARARAPHSRARTPSARSAA